MTQKSITYQDKSNRIPIANRPEQVVGEDLNEVKEIVNDNAADAELRLGNLETSETSVRKNLDAIARISSTFDDTQTIGDPGTGLFRLNGTEDALFISYTQNQGSDIKSILETLNFESILKIQSGDNKFRIFKVTGLITDNTTWAVIPISALDSGDAFIDGDLCGFDVYGNQLINRDASGNQLGYKYIPADFDFTSIPAGYDNSIWEIRYEHDLGGLDVDLSETGQNITGVELDFEGGMISNYGTIKGYNTKIKAGLNQVFDTSGTFAGSWLTNYVLPEWFGSVGDNIADDLSAIIKSDQLAKLAKCDLIIDQAHSLSNKITQTASWIGKGKLINTNAIADFVTTGANEIELNIELDHNDALGAIYKIIHDDVIFDGVARNSAATGVIAIDCNNPTIKGQIYDTIDQMVFVNAATQDVSGVKIDTYCDSVSKGITQANGGVKVHGSASYKVIAPDIRAKVLLAKDINASTNCVGIETLINVEDARVTGYVEGGRIGVTLNNSPGSVGVGIVCSGQSHLQFEIDKSDNARYSACVGSGGFITTTIGCQSNQSKNIEFNCTISDAFRAVYLTETDNAVVRVTANDVGTFLRLRITNNINVVGSYCDMSANPQVAYLVNLDTTAYNTVINGGYFIGFNNIFQTSGAGFVGDGIKIVGGAIIENDSTLFIAGGGTITRFFISDNSELKSKALPARITHVKFIDATLNPPLIHGYSNDAVEGFVTAARGSIVYRTDGVSGTLLYVKESTTGNTGWVVK